MPDKYPRKPIGNFFIKKDLQIRLIAKIVLSVLLATVVFAVTLLITYHIMYSSAAFYQVTLAKGAPEIGDRLKIVTILLPSMCISAVVNVLLAVCVGLYASRKYAVPIFKLEKWASLLLEGKFTAVLRFREKDEMKELSDKCNACTQLIRNKLLTIRDLANRLAKDGPVSEPLKQIQAEIGLMELDSEAFEVRTGQYRMRDN